MDDSVFLDSNNFWKVGKRSTFFGETREIIALQQFSNFSAKGEKVWGRILRDGGFWPNGPFSRVKINSGFNINQLLTILGALPPTLCQISKQQNFPSRVVYNSKLQLFRKILKIQGFLVQYLHQNRNDEKNA